MTVETCSYTLSLSSKAVGSQVLRTAAQGRTTTLEARALFQGVFGQQSLTQTSQLFSDTLESLRFSEEATSKGDKRSFEVVFDGKSGLVRATRRVGAQLERAETPLVQPYSDPLGLLQRLRRSAHGRRVGEAERVPLLGKDVVVEYLGESEVETGLGLGPAFGYILYPGPSYVYVDTRSPHTLVRLLQPTQHGLLEAFLTRRVEEEDSSSTAAPATSEGRSGKRRRRGGRRRRRVES
jgi:hypothetical protein